MIIKITKKVSKKLSEEVWTFLAETGKFKCEMPWELYKKVETFTANCPLCAIFYKSKNIDDSGWLYPVCPKCPMTLAEQTCHQEKHSGKLDYFSRWTKAKTPKTRKKYAKLTLGIIKAWKI